MRREWIWGLAAVVALTIGATCAEGYARLATPYYAAITRLIAAMHPWKIDTVEVAQDDSGRGAVLRLKGEVRRHRDDPRPAALVVGRVQVGEAIDTPVVFWTLLLVWPAKTQRQRLWRVIVGIPLFLSLEAATTACQLIHSLAEASALLAGQRDPLTLWERWSRFLVLGGSFVLAATAALLAIAAVSRSHPANIA